MYHSLWQVLTPVEQQLLSIMPLFAQAGAELSQLQTICGLSEASFWPALTRLLALFLIEQRGDQDQPRYGSHNLTRHYIQNEDWYHELETAGSPLAASVRANITYWREYLSQRSDTQEVMRDAVCENILRAVQISLQLPQQNSLATEHIEILR